MKQMLVKRLYLLLATTQVAVAASSILPPIFDNNNFEPSEVIERDVCIIGGGATGTYAAVRLRDMNHSVLIVEKERQLGGQTQTYIDAKTGASEELGVVVYQPTNITRGFFGRFDVPLRTLSFGGNTSQSPTQQFDFRSGTPLPDSLEPSANDTEKALQNYAHELAKYPYLASGFDLEYPVPPDLLSTFGEFALKYNLSAAVRTIFNYAQGLGDFLDQPTIYVMKNFGLVDLVDISKTGYLTSADGRNVRLYEQAGKWLGRDQISLQSSVVATARRQTMLDDPTSHRSRVLISTPTGLKLVLAKKILFTAPPLLSNLDGWDLDDEEHFVFSQLTNCAYYTGLLNNTGLSAPNGLLQNAALESSFNLPIFPGIYSLTPAPQISKDAFSVKYGSPVPLAEDAVKDDILAAVQRLRKNHTGARADFLAFESHTPFEMTVAPEAIADGYYERLDGLQGRNGMFYTGATFHTQDSALLWQFTEDKILPRLSKGLELELEE